MDDQWRVGVPLEDRLIAGLVYRARRGGLLQRLLVLRGTDVHPLAKIGPGLRLRHGGIGVVVHPATTIGRDVTLYPGVTIGRADIWRDVPDTFGGFVIEDDVILCANSTVISSSPEPLVVGRGTVLGANSVLRNSTGPGEVWAGVPARLVGHR